MSLSPTPAERAALRVGHSALANSPHPCSDIVSQVVFALGASGLLQSPETAAELVTLRARVAKLVAAPILEATLLNEDEDEEPTPGQVAATAIYAFKDPSVIGCVISRDSLRIMVKPADLDVWDRWMARLSVEVGLITHRGEYCTAEGTWNGTPIQIIGLGVSELVVAKARAYMDWQREAERHELDDPAVPPLPRDLRSDITTGSTS